MSAPPTLETRQLLLRAPLPTDVDALFEIQGNPEAMRHTWVAPDRDATARYLDAYAARFAHDGFAPWTAVLRQEERIVGWGGLNRDPEAPQYGVEVSYFVHSAYWGRGLATELVQASLRLAFRDLGLGAVSAFTRPANHGSKRVLEKAGFEFVRHVAELERDQYRIDSGTWEAPPDEAHRQIDERLSMNRIYVARHGQSTWNAERRWTGHGDPPLSEAGRAQAREACETLGTHRFDAVSSSALIRARETASIVASALDLPLLEPIRHFDERFAGLMSGMTSEEIESRWPGFLDRWRSGHPVEIPNGEPWQAFVDRVLEGLEHLRTVPGRILLVSHMGVQRAIEHGFGRPLRWYGNLEGLWVDPSGRPGEKR